MDDRQFAEITKAIAQETSRRGAMARLLGGLVAGLGGAVLTSGRLDAKGKKGGKAKQGGKSKSGRKNRGNAAKGGGARVASRSLVVNTCPDGTSPKQCPAASGIEYSCKIAASGAGCDVNGPNPPDGSIQVCCEDDTGPNSCREKVAEAGFVVPDAKFCYCNPGGGCTVGSESFAQYEVVGVEGGAEGTCVPASCDCSPLTCDDLGANACGTEIEDGCGGTISCGCNDHDKCTEDSCSATAAGEVGVCQYVPKDCSQTQGVDQCNEGYCDADSGECKTRPVADGTECNDGLYCTVGDSCQAGVCVGNDRDCSGQTDQCNTGVCDETANECVKQPTPGVACNDGLFCTVDDTCDAAGACVGTPRDCSTASDQCNTGVCDEAADACIPVYEPGPCNDGLFCTIDDVCVEQSDGSGTCQSGPARDCSHKTDQCNLGVCDEAADKCVKQPTPGVTCNDGLFCTVDDTCDADGECVGNARDCSAQSDQCNTGVCDESADACVKQPKQDGTTCSDGKACTVNDTCKAGTCESGGQKVCPPVECKPNCICTEPNGTCVCRANTCTRTQGYWKTHPEKWDQASEVVAVPGFPSFTTSSPKFFSSGKSYLNAMLASSSDGNGYYALAQQYIAALINIARGACVPAAILSADGKSGALVDARKLFVAATSGTFTKAQKATVSALIAALTAYNEGATGPGHCG